MEKSQKKSDDDHEQRIPVRPYKLRELADMYGMDRRTFGRWLKMHRKYIGMRIGQYYTVNQVLKIFERIGTPGGSADN